MTKRVLTFSFVAILAFSVCHAGDQPKDRRHTPAVRRLWLHSEKNPEARRPKNIDSTEGLLLVFKREKDKR